MKTLGRVVGVMMLAEGVLVASMSHEYLRFWDREGMPAWMRNLVRPWLALPQGALRMAGVGEALTGGLMLDLAEHSR